MRHSISKSLFCLLTVGVVTATATDAPVARWKFAGDTQNAIGTGLNGENHGVNFRDGTFPARFGEFNGSGNHVSIAADESLMLGTSDFTLGLWVNTDAESDDDLGDLISQFDTKTRTGFHLSLRNNSGVTHSQSNYRQLQFGIDAGTEPVFTDEGRPGHAVYGQSMAVHDGRLYVGTCETGTDQAGHVYVFDGQDNWLDLGTPDRSNSITGMAAFQGELYVGSGKYRLGGSALQESENRHLGGRIFRYQGDASWKEVGHFPEMEAVGGMVVFRGQLYVGSLYKPAAFVRYDGGNLWTPLSLPNGKRVEALGVFNGFLWATGYDEGHVYRFDGTEWKDLGRVGEEENTQTYAFATYQGKLHVATWRTGKVFNWDNGAWHDRGRLGEELEVMGMLVHNGSFYAGTLPTGQIYRYDGDQTWSLLKQLDTTPDVKYRRVWTMAQYRGKLFATTLPSAHIWSMQTGNCLTWDREFPAGWHHVAAQRDGNTLRMFFDGELVAESVFDKERTLDLNCHQPWRIGAGSGDYFRGSLADVQFYRKALTREQIRNLTKHD